MKKICVVIGSRANYGSIKSVLHEIKKNKKLKLQIICNTTAVLDRYGNVYKKIKNDGFKIDKIIYNQIEGENPVTMTKSTGVALIEIASAFNEINPNIVFVIGDRHEVMATAIASAYMNIPLAHTMGGEISGTIDESIRHSITKLAHIHFVSTKKSKENLIKMGELKNNVFLVGCPRMDLIKQHKTLKNDYINQIVNKEGVGDKLDLNHPFMLVSHHPVTTEISNQKKSITNVLNAIDKIKMQKIVLWPNSDAGSDIISRQIRIWQNKTKSKVRIFKNFDNAIYVQLMKNTSVLVGNTSSGIREGSFIGTPFVNIGSRQTYRERGENTIDCKEDQTSIVNSINRQLKKHKVKPSNLYGDGNASKKIVKILNNLKDINIQKVLN